MAIGDSEDAPPPAAPPSALPSADGGGVGGDTIAPSHIHEGDLLPFWKLNYPTS
jgi:hypothetical protein